MKHHIAMLILATSLTAFAEPGPNQDQDQQQQGQDQQQQDDGRDHDHCPGGCYPYPPISMCYVQMTDCYHRPLYTYWGRMPTKQQACGIALDLCMRDVYLGRGGYGARCYILGK